MNNLENIPNTSNKYLAIATISALVIAIIIYLFVILPAEYNIDPTGMGKKLGLTVLSQENIVAEVKQEIKASQYDYREDRVLVNVPANKGIEYKFDMKQHGNLTYEWKTSNETQMYFDFHGEPAGDTTGYFESYTIATTFHAKGSATVPFEGVHGWYWENTSDQNVNIELKTFGNYQVLGIK